MACRIFKSNNTVTTSLMLIPFLIAAFLTMSFVAGKDQLAAPATNKGYGPHASLLNPLSHKPFGTKVPEEVLVWKFGGGSGNLTSNNHYENNRGYNLFCETNQKFLVWSKQLIGINLNYSKDEQTKFHLRTKDNKEREIKTGDVVALGIGLGEAFLEYEERTMGINLGWSKEPKYQWQIFGASGKAGEPVVLGESYAIINVKVKPEADFLVYLDRVYGQADIGWTTSPNWPKRVLSNVKKYSKIAVGLYMGTK